MNQFVKRKNQTNQPELKEGDNFQRIRFQSGALFSVGFQNYGAESNYSMSFSTVGKRQFLKMFDCVEKFAGVDRWQIGVQVNYRH